MVRAGYCRHTRAPRWLILEELSAWRVIPSKEVRISGTRDHSRVPEETTVNAGPLRPRRRCGTRPGRRTRPRRRRSSRRGGSSCSSRGRSRCSRRGRCSGRGGWADPTSWRPRITKCRMGTWKRNESRTGTPSRSCRSRGPHRATGRWPQSGRRRTPSDHSATTGRKRRM